MLSKEAGAQVEQHGRDNDLVERIRASDYFAPVHSKLEKLLYPSTFIGRAPQQVYTALVWDYCIVIQYRLVQLLYHTHVTHVVLKHDNSEISIIAPLVYIKVKGYSLPCIIFTYPQVELFLQHEVSPSLQHYTTLLDEVSKLTI